ncbi:2-amino-4-hydroxy-6-hydroxymethyldihydropteridine diphosphokinase [Candidatus Pantoea carbekii]|uniref:2-amino-4-hydroxy-6-hydroxymethyldihydropteridine pyrophosphokinase n=1 Tax=Candidatus Pantoea carbekii TaxID=1235990 RepID=U3U7N2_9GAMM|nr:2-amino-4-hydroxy-6-hydroxymethyldihydropteridine diphosphokinase [Candidatus Pantoea carbekii]AKC31910.1 2-amino-4-hydroxy-6- hydroxymethyldihydropteridine pyrophosphokinase [Candidatus Pantoea carbekii]BAO00427.1 hypothetical protein HHS_04570 [Candidatus Pantoea carbekii]
MTIVYLALGSNLTNPFNQIKSAFAELDALPCSSCITTSSLYRTPPYGLLDQPDYLNAVISLESTLLPEVLLDHIQHIEKQHGRVRTEKHWEARTLDIDILLFGDAVINTPSLTIPHYDMCRRAFMLVPLLEIAPRLLLPNGYALVDLVAQLKHSEIRLWNE